MLILLARIPVDGQRLTGEEPPERLDLEGDPLLRAAGPLRYDLTVQLLSRQLLVQGRLEATLRVMCSRCGVFCSTKVVVSSFVRDYELTGDEESIEIADDLREEILLAAPGFPLCAADCRGLCPRCGQNLNQGPCGCPAVAEHVAWGALDGLKTQGTE